MKHLLRLALIGTALLLAGCMTTGTNMHGNFQCRAPDGTCAPMSLIDAKAVAGLAGTMQPVGGIADPMPRGGRVVTASVDGSPPGRTADRVLRVVFPAHIDASGIYHDESTAHAVVERGAWTAGMTGGDHRNDASVMAANVQPGATDNLQTFNSDTAPSKLATLDEIIAARAVQAREPQESGGAAPASPVVRSSPAAVMTPASAPMRSSRSSVALDLREAAAAASAGSIAGLDPNFDTPDVAAIVAADVSPVGDACIAYHRVRWHGHSYRRPFKVPCPVVAGASAAVPTAVAGTTQALNLAALTPPSLSPAGQGAHAAIAAPPAGSPLSPPSALPSPSAPPAAAEPPLSAPPSEPSASSVPAPTAGAAAGFVPTTDGSVAAARVSMLAKPIIADQVRLGRANANAAAPASLGDLLAGTGVTASAVTGDTPQ